jgi:hypothetical protein
MSSYSHLTRAHNPLCACLECTADPRPGAQQLGLGERTGPLGPAVAPPPPRPRGTVRVPTTMSASNAPTPSSTAWGEDGAGTQPAGSNLEAAGLGGPSASGHRWDPGSLHEPSGQGRSAAAVVPDPSALPPGTSPTASWPAVGAQTTRTTTGSAQGHGGLEGVALRTATTGSKGGPRDGSSDPGDGSRRVSVHDDDDCRTDNAAADDADRLVSRVWAQQQQGHHLDLGSVPEAAEAVALDQGGRGLDNAGLAVMADQSHLAPHCNPKRVEQRGPQLLGRHSTTIGRCLPDDVDEDDGCQEHTAAGNSAHARHSSSEMVGSGEIHASDAREGSLKHQRGTHWGAVASPPPFGGLLLLEGGLPAAAGVAAPCSGRYERDGGCGVGGDHGASSSGEVPEAKDASGGAVASHPTSNASPVPLLERLRAVAAAAGTLPPPLISPGLTSPAHSHRAWAVGSPDHCQGQDECSTLGDPRRAAALGRSPATGGSEPFLVGSLEPDCEDVVRAHEQRRELRRQMRTRVMYLAVNAPAAVAGPGKGMASQRAGMWRGRGVGPLTPAPPADDATVAASIHGSLGTTVADDQPHRAGHGSETACVSSSSPAGSPARQPWQAFQQALFVRKPAGVCACMCVCVCVGGGGVRQVKQPPQ